jgi:hypothetical protein
MGLLSIPVLTFPKYTTQLLNLASSNSGATRPRVVGQMSDLVVESNATTVEEWREFYSKTKPDAPEIAVDKVEVMLDNLRTAIDMIDRDMIERWVDDVLINKTFYGFAAQESILTHLSDKVGHCLREATPEDEAVGIDGYIGDQPVSIKPSSYKQKSELMEEIGYPIIYYEKTKTGLRIEADELDEYIDK